MQRRQFLTQLTGFWLLASHSSRPSAQSFADYQQTLQQQFQQHRDDWTQYRQRYQQAVARHQQQLQQQWQQVWLSSRRQWVSHSDDGHSRVRVDYQQRRIDITLRQPGMNQQQLEQQWRQLLQALQQQSYRQAVASDPTLLTPPTQGLPETPVLALPDWQPDFSQARQNTDSDGVHISIDLPAHQGVLPPEAQTLLPLIRRSANKWRVPIPLVLAIMQTESSFNPMARSPVPAFGLMQIVPATAGRDASKHALGQERLLGAGELMQPALNIELGCAYLNLLERRYLAAVQHPQSRRWCVIAAYNTGAGNVARAFSGNHSVAAAAARINALTPAQVFQHLRQHLPYAETRRYIVKVDGALSAYAGVN
jgi:membrane-bound lytic murein transglycosylase C